MKYQEPEMDIIKLESADIITTSSERLIPSDEGGSGGIGWSELP